MAGSAQFTLCLTLSLLLITQQDAAAVQPQPGDSKTAQATNSSLVKVPKGTEVDLVLMETLSSADAEKGQTVRMSVDSDVTVNEAIVIPKGTPAAGVVKHTRRAEPGKKDGFVVVEASKVNLADGTHLKLRTYPPEEDDCGDLGPCWRFWTEYLPLMIVIDAVAVIPDLIAYPFERRRQSHPATTRSQEPKVEGEDEILRAGYKLTECTAKLYVTHAAIQP